MLKKSTSWWGCFVLVWCCCVGWDGGDVVVWGVFGVVVGLEFGEAVWEGGADGWEDEDAVFAGEEELDVGFGDGFVFEEGLAAGSAGGYGVGEFVAVGAAGGDCDCEEVGVGVGGVCVVGCGAFGAESGGVGGVFLVAAGDDGAVAESDGCAD